MLRERKMNINNAADINRYTTITFRISTHVLNKLRGQSENKGVSLNSVVNQVLKHYVEWEEFEPQMGMIPFPKNVLHNIFSDMSQEQIIKLAANVGKDTAIDMAIFMKGRIDFSGFISWIEMRMKNSDSQFVHRINEDGEHTIIIRHSLGRHWSLYLKVMLVSALTEVFKAQVKDVIMTDSMISFICKKNEGQNPEVFPGLPT
jgi:hypothetical protein